jgi:hypothetical protein
MHSFAQVNTFPWLLDYVAEEITQGEDARKNWEASMLRLYHEPFKQI